MAIKVFPKAGIFFSHYECFGHTSRVMAVGEIFKKRFPRGKIFFIQAGVRQPKAQIDQLGQVYLLPKPFMDRRNFIEPIQGAGVNTAARTQTCLDIVIRQKPDIFVTEFFPLGRDECRYELIPSLLKASSQGAALWAVAGYPIITGTSHEWREKILKLYQQIIIFSPSEEKDFIAASFTRNKQRQEYLDFFKRHAQKIKFAGYLLAKQEIVSDGEDKKLDKLSVPKGACRVTVLRGGGAYYSKVIAEAIRASDLLGKEYYFTVVAGPSTTQKEWDLFVTLAGKKKFANLNLLRAVGDYEGLIQNSDVCVSTASYHTTVMLLKHRKKAVLIPFEGQGPMTCREQPARATMLREMIGAKILSIQELTAKTLSVEIKQAAARVEKIAPIPREWFMGEDLLGQSLIRLFGQ